MVKELRDQGIILHLHICGDTDRITDDFIATGAPVLEIDTNLLVFGTPGEIDIACEALISTCKQGGGFILGPGCALAPTTPADNIHALVESARRYGSYR
jgi:uroporphyrinogen-III decarboxylase